MTSYQINWPNALWLACLLLGCLVIEDIFFGTAGSWATVPLYVLIGGISTLFIGPVLGPSNDPD